MPGVHIDKLTKNIAFDIDKKPVGATQWDFMIGMNIRDNLLQKYGQGPEAVFLYLNNYCSADCPKCSAKPLENMGMRLFENILVQLTGLKVKYIILDGEALLHPKAMDMIGRLIGAGFQVSMNIAKEVTVEEVKKIQEMGIKKIQMRMEGLSSHYEDKARFAALEKTLAACMAAGEYSSVIFSIGKDNLGSVPSFIEFCERYRVGQFSFIRLPACIYSRIEPSKILSAKEFRDLSHYLVEKRKEMKDSVHITSNEAIWKGCGAAFISCAIKHDGTVIPCIYLDEGGASVEKEGLAHIWSSPMFTRLRKAEGFGGRCGNCDYLFYCKGCRAVASSINHGAFEEDPGCWL